jgi:putative FmdB family regulatory protein
MPLYEYECEACGKRFEIIQKFSDAPPDTCRVCAKGPVRRLMSSPAIQFKGSGWYITDYSQKGKPTESSTTSGDAKDASKTTDAKTTSESKPDGGGASETAAKPAAAPSTSKSDAT